MSTKAPRFSGEEFARRGREIYERVIRPRLRPEDDGKLVAIDIESDEYAIDSDGYQASERLIERNPNAQIWLARVGRATTYRLGGQRHGTAAK
jgi:hypothetical protein